MLQVDLRELARGPVETKAELARDDPLLEGVAVALADPVAVGGRLQPAGEGRFYLQGSLRTPGTREGRRCPPPLNPGVAAGNGGVFTQDPHSPGGPNSHSLPPPAPGIDPPP